MTAWRLALLMVSSESMPLLWLEWHVCDRLINTCCPFNEAQRSWLLSKLQDNSIPSGVIELNHRICPPWCNDSFRRFGRCSSLYSGNLSTKRSCNHCFKMVFKSAAMNRNNNYHRWVITWNEYQHWRKMKIFKDQLLHIAVMPLVDVVYSYMTNVPIDMRIIGWEHLAIYLPSSLMPLLHNRSSMIDARTWCRCSDSFWFSSW